MDRINLPKQTKEWEMACVKTRRNEGKRKKRLSIFNFKKNSKILDLGCGDGLNINILRKMDIPNLVGVDISNDLIKIAKKNNPKTKFYKAKAERLPFKSSSFDVVLVDSVFHHILDYEAALKEIKRVLKEKGKLCFIEPHNSLTRHIYDGVCEMSFSKYVPFLKNRRESYLNEIDFMKHWLSTEDEFYSLLNKFGFVKSMAKKDLLSIIGIYEVKKNTKKSKN